MKGCHSGPDEIRVVCHGGVYVEDYARGVDFRVRLERDGEDDGEIAGSAAFERPEEVGVLGFICGDEVALCSDDVEGESVVRRCGSVSSANRSIRKCALPIP